MRTLLNGNERSLGFLHVVTREGGVIESTLSARIDWDVAKLRRGRRGDRGGSFGLAVAGALQPAPFVIWGGNTPGLALGQRVNFWGNKWFCQVKNGDYKAGTSFMGFVKPAATPAAILRARGAHQRQPVARHRLLDRQVRQRQAAGVADATLLPVEKVRFPSQAACDKASVAAQERFYEEGTKAMGGLYRRQLLFDLADFFGCL
jgi:hypothetical protein